MTQWLEWLRQYAVEAGISGLFTLSVIDSAGVPTGGGPDIAIALMASLRSDVLFLTGLIASAVVGSVIGCYILYWIGRRGGDTVGQRFAPDTIARARAQLKRHGAWIVFLAVLAPPPIPTKLFALSAGVVLVRQVPFVIATFVGRLIRYTAGALLAAHFGPAAIEAIQADAQLLLVFLIPPILIGLILLIIRRRRQSKADSPPIS